MNTVARGEKLAIFKSLEEVQGSAGREVGVSPWVEVTQERITTFGKNTGDEYWIHMDAERAKRDSPFGNTIAHGFLLLSLLAEMMSRTVRYEWKPDGLNYGLNRVRFINPVPAGSRIRGRFEVGSVKFREGGGEVTWKITVEREGAEKPALAAEWVTRVGF